MTSGATPGFPIINYLVKLFPPLEVYLGDHSLKYATGYGTVTIRLPNEEYKHLHKVYLVPGLAKNLLSVSTAIADGVVIEFHPSHCVIKQSLSLGAFIHIACPKQGRLYPLGTSTVPSITSAPAIALATTTSIPRSHDTLLWHYRLGHLSLNTMKHMQSSHLVTSFSSPLGPIDICEECIYGKSTHQRFPHSSTTSSYPLQLIHSDLCGPMPVPSLTGSLYFLTFIDDYTKYTILSFIKHKSEVLTKFQYYHTYVERQLQTPLRTIRINNGAVSMSLKPLRSIVLQKV